MQKQNIETILSVIDLDRPKQKNQDDQAGEAESSATVHRLGRKSLGEILVERHKITEEQLLDALKQQQFNKPQEL